MQLSNSTPACADCVCHCHCGKHASAENYFQCTHREEGKTVLRSNFPHTRDFFCYTLGENLSFQCKSRKKVSRRVAVWKKSKNYLWKRAQIWSQNDSIHEFRDENVTGVWTRDNRITRCSACQRFKSRVWMSLYFLISEPCVVRYRIYTAAHSRARALV